MKDVAMAQEAGVTDVWAKYGEAHWRDEYELLRKVTHWPREAVEKERALSVKDIIPSHVLSKQFGELKDLFFFSPPPDGMDRGGD